MKHRTATGIVAAGALLAAMAAPALQRGHDRIRTMTDSQLMAVIDSCISQRAPLTAEPYVAEARNRARLRHDFALEFDLIGKQQTLDARRHGLAGCELLETECAKASPPLRQMLAASIAMQKWPPDDALAYAEAATHDPDSSCSRTPATVALGRLATDSLIDGRFTLIDALRNQVVQWCAAHQGMARADSLRKATVGLIADGARHRHERSRLLMLALAADAEARAQTSDLGADGIDSLWTPIDALPLDDTARAVGLHRHALCLLRSGFDDTTASRALRLTDSALAMCPASAAMAATMEMIVRPGLRATFESSARPGSAVPMRLEYRNADTAFVLIFAGDPDRGARRHTGRPLRIDTIALPQFGCLTSRTVYTEIAAPEAGCYDVAVRHSIGTGPFDTERMDCTDVMLTAESTPQGLTLTALDATTGLPVPDADVAVLHGYKGRFAHAGRTDAHGQFDISLHLMSDHRTTIQVTRGNSRTRLAVYGSSSRSPQGTRQHTWIFADRAVYRPGQTVRFKIVSFSNNADSAKCTPDAGRALTVRLLDADRNTVSTVSLTANGFGSASGRFVVPTGALCGSWAIADDSGVRCHIGVEEYKRGTTRITFEPHDSVVVRGDTVRCRGRVEALGGYALGGSLVGYTIEWADTAVTGRCRTDADGRFAIAWPADEACYHIRCSATDLSGQTAEGSDFVVVDRQGFGIDATVDDSFADAATRIGLSCRNANGRPARGTASVSIHSAALPDTLLPISDLCANVDRRLTTPSVQPGPDRPRLLRRVFAADISIDGDTAITLPASALAPGLYRLTMRWTDACGTLHTDSCSFARIARGSHTDCGSRLLLKALADTVTPGGRLGVIVGSALRDAHIRLTLTTNGIVAQTAVCHVSRSQEAVWFDVPASADGKPLVAIGLHATMVRHNRIYTASAAPAVERKPPFAIRLTTWRNLSEPGSRERLSVLMPPDVEAVATLYDAALDDIAGPLRWSTPGNGAATFGHSVFHTTVGTGTEGHGAAYLHPWFGVRDLGYRYSAGVRLAMAKGGMPMLAEAAMTVSNAEADDAFEAETESAEAATDATLRRNFAETALFCPHLTAGADSMATADFSLPHTITRFNLSILAHNRQMQVSRTADHVDVRRQLMIRPGLPRFVRQGDRLTLTPQIVSLAGEPLQALCSIAAVDTLTNDSIVISQPSKSIRIEPGGTAAVEWTIDVPDHWERLRISISARAGSHTDAVSQDMGVEPRQIVCHESQPVAFAGSGRHVSTCGLGGGTTRSLRFDYTTDVASDILLALPAIADFDYPSIDCHVAQLMAAGVARSMSADTAVAAIVARMDSAAPKTMPDADPSTPWTRVRQDIDRRRHRLESMLDADRADAAILRALGLIEAAQMPDGSFAWCPGMTTSEHMTRHVMAALGRMHLTGLTLPEQTDRIVAAGVDCLDGWIERDERELQRTPQARMGASTLHLLYARSLFARFALPDACRRSIGRQWAEMEPDCQIMAAEVLMRAGLTDMAASVIESLCQNLVRSEAHCAWVNVGQGRGSVRVQALMLMMLRQHRPQSADIGLLSNWLMMQKRTQLWGNARDAVVALQAIMPAAARAASATDTVSIGTATAATRPGAAAVSIAAPDGAQAVVVKSRSEVSFGNWQRTAAYDIAAIGAQPSSCLRLTRTVSTHRDGRWLPADKCTPRVGERVRVELTVEATQDIDFVRITDRRPAALEPTEKQSGYRWAWRMQTGHYLNVTDTGIDFFVDRLRKGRHTFAYEAYATNAGTFAPGYADARSVYAPETAVHTGTDRTMEIEKPDAQ